MSSSTDDSQLDRLDGVFAALGKMADPDLVALSGVWMGGDADLRREAWSKVRSVPVQDPRALQLEQSRDRLGRWVNDVGLTWAGAYERSIVVPQGADQGNLRRNAVPSILDAIAATLFTDILTVDESDELLAPFRHVTEPESEPRE